MDFPRAVTSGWEHRLPGLDKPWTHWVLLGNNETRLGAFAVNDISGALKAVAENFGKFTTIKAVKAAMSLDGALREDRALYEISNLAFDSVLLESPNA